MQLKQMTAYGFKSFADKVTLDFDQGITAIVGPNGSGKSNITDAIRWVLGEQNVRNLRGTRSEDIIFTGSASRHALGVAEVSLVLDNSDETLPVDFREVVVTRRLYRSGESEFFINNSRCRLKDIYNLFADTGIGHDGMSIIGQNRIDAILNARPEERRGFFEETAGITKYRNRKREALRKLNDTEQNLVRVQDIIGELSKQLEPLAEQAEKTRQWQALQGEYDKCRLGSLAHTYTEVATQQAENAAKLQAAQDEVLAAGTAVQQAEASQTLIGKAITDLEQAMQQQAEKNEVLRGKLETAGREMAALSERQKQGARRQAQLAEEHTAQAEARQKLAQELTQLQRELAQQETEQQDTAAQLEESHAAVKAGKQRQMEADQELQAADAARQESEQALTASRQELAVLDRDVENGSDGQSAQEQAVSEADAAWQALQKQQQDLGKELEVQEQAVETAMQRQQQSVQAARQARQQAVELQEQQLGIQQSLQGTRQQLQFLQRMQQSYEGFGKAPKAILKQQTAWRQGVCGAVAELLHVPAKYAVAIEVALGGSLQDIVTEDTATAKQAIAFLKKNHLGRVTFLPLSTLVVRQPREQVSGEGVLGWAHTLVSCEAHYAKARDFLLARTLVVDTLDHALVLAKAHGYRLRMVTLEGELLSPGGSLSGGSMHRREASFLSRQGEMEALQEKLQQLTKAQERAAEDARQAADKRQQAEQAQQEALSALQQENVRRAELRTQLSSQQQALRRAEQRLAEAKQEAGKRQATFAELQQQRLKVFRRTGELEILCRQQAQAVAAAQEKQRAAQLQLTAAQQKLQEQELAQAVLEQTVLRSRERVQQCEESIARAQEMLQSRQQEAASLQSAQAAGESRRQALTAKQAAWQRAYDAGRQARDALYQQRTDKLGEAREAEQKAKAATQRQTACRERVHGLELVATKLQLALQDKAETLLHDFGLTPERAQEEAPDLPPETLKERMKGLKHQLDKLGPVNPNALQEYEDMAARHAFLEKQATDLQEARANLQRILDEMDAAMTKQFKEAFHDIQRYFADIFVRLFGGGAAELKLLEPDDVLASGVDILVTLPEKKRQNLAALSGGERALTVIALLFAFLKYRPSPFVVLDEIDAPLDEANVVRFGQFLKEFAAQTQFLVVTHRKGTMAAVDTMYGVTIEDAGVSKVLSVKLDEINEGA
ncbi:MAG: chromosome segregation protein SMC [Selenomonas sp.]|nr:chromosome segregation protein SMC [Selenomonas sp.]